jgi:hypothetical protein
MLLSQCYNRINILNKEEGSCKFKGIGRKSLPTEKWGCEWYLMQDFISCVKNQCLYPWQMPLK